MKTITSILFLTVFCCLYTHAQTTSSKKSAHLEVSTEPDNASVSDNSSATCVSGGKNATVKEIPLENKENTGNSVPATNETTPLSRKPD